MRLKLRHMGHVVDRIGNELNEAQLRPNELPRQLKRSVSGLACYRWFSA